MICNDCGVENKPTAKFCLSCGSPLGNETKITAPFPYIKLIGIGFAFLVVVVMGVLIHPWLPWVGAAPIQNGSVHEAIQRLNLIGNGPQVDLEKVLGPEVKSYSAYLEVVKNCYSDYMLQRRRAGFPSFSIMYFHNNIKVFKDQAKASDLIIRFTGTGPDMNDYAIYYRYGLNENRIVGVERGIP